jgi:phage tail-like protein
MTMDIKTIREGGNNTSQIRLAGAVNYGLLTLKRGMTESFDLWRWVAALYAPRGSGLRGTARVVILAPDGKDRIAFLLTGVLPAKLKAPPLNARDGAVAIEELQLAYETMHPDLPS